MKLVIVALLPLMVAGCETTKYQPSLVPDIKEEDAQRAAEICLSKNVPQLDDGVSPANIVGVSVADVCGSELRALAMQEVKYDNYAVQREFYLRSREVINALATRAVLTYRRSVKAK